MLFGLQHENEAAKAYSKFTGNNVYPVGMVINPTAPYLGCSPDRRVFDNFEEEKFGLLEIKCPQSTSYTKCPIYNRISMVIILSLFIPISIKFKGKWVSPAQNGVT